MTANILDPKWRYVRSEATDLRKTFAAVRKRLAEEAKSKAANEAEAVKKVKQIGGKR